VDIQTDGSAAVETANRGTVFSVPTVPRCYKQDSWNSELGPMLSSERMLHKDYDRKVSVEKNNLWS
jgi:hypothetical protein